MRHKTHLLKIGKQSADRNNDNDDDDADAETQGCTVQGGSEKIWCLV